MVRKIIVSNDQVTFFIGVFGLVFGLIGDITDYFGIKSYFDKKEHKELIKKF